VNYTHAAPGTANAIYQPHGGPFYAPRLNENRMFAVRPGIGGADDGATLIGYKTHAPGNVVQSPRFVYHQRSDPEWQEYVYPPSRRDLVNMQAPMKYTIGNSLVLARPFDPSNYFLGYQAPANAMTQASGSTTSKPLGSR
jgi:hypothetical protein